MDEITYRSNEAAFLTSQGEQWLMNNQDDWLRPSLVKPQKPLCGRQDSVRQLVQNEQYLAPRLRLEFDPSQPKFVSPTTTVGNYKMLYVRVLARAVSPTVKDCRVYLQRVSQVDGEKYVTLFD